MRIGFKGVRSVTIALVGVLALGALAHALDGQVLSDNFRKLFTERNPLLVGIQVLESKPVSPKSSSNHVYLVRAIRADNKFEGKFEDEQFGVFLVDVNKSQVIKTLDIFNTPRWNDYELKIKRVSPSKVIVSGRGATYGDHPITKTYSFGAAQ